MFLQGKNQNLFSDFFEKEPNKDWCEKCRYLYKKRNLHATFTEDFYCVAHGKLCKNIEICKTRKFKE